MMQHRIESETGLTCSIGIAPNAFLAKICSDWKKPKGFFTLRPHEVAPFLEQIPLKSIPGVGPTTLKSLNAIGIKNLQQIRHFDFPLLEQTLGKFAFDLKNFAYGIDQRDLWAQEARKNLSVEHTYIQDLVRPLEWKSAIEDLFPVLEGRLNRYRTRENDQRSISGIVLKLKFHDFENRTLSCSLGPKNQPSPPSSPLIKEKFYLLLEQAIKRWENRPLRLLGIGVVFQKDTHQESQSEDDHIQIQNSLFEFGLGDLKN